MSVRLRPHHLLCIQKYTGHGYDEAFSKHMDAFTLQLKQEPETEITLHNGCDYLCGSCPFNKEGTCMSEPKVTGMDNGVLDVCGFTYEQTGKWKELSQKAKEKIFDTEEFNRICGNCQWYELCESTHI